MLHPSLQGQACLKAPAGMATRRSGLLPNFFYQMSFLRNLKAPAGMTTRRSGLLPQIIFAGCHFLYNSRYWLEIIF